MREQSKGKAAREKKKKKETPGRCTAVDRYSASTSDVLHTPCAYSRKYTLDCTRIRIDKRKTVAPALSKYFPVYAESLYTHVCNSR